MSVALFFLGEFIVVISLCLSCKQHRDCHFSYLRLYCKCKEYTRLRFNEMESEEISAIINAKFGMFKVGDMVHSNDFWSDRTDGLQNNTFNGVITSFDGKWGSKNDIVFVKTTTEEIRLNIFWIELDMPPAVKIDKNGRITSFIETL
jgi:hypothetical protein